MATIAFIGLGTMGRPMAAHQARAGHTVRGVDLDEGARAAAAEQGVTPMTSIAQAVRGADVVITMLPQGDHVRAVYLGEDGVIAHATDGALLIDSSTIDVRTCADVHEAAHAAGLDFVDAPVSGGRSGAVAGTLTFMVGGRGVAVERARPVLAPMAGAVIPTGGPTTGEAAKICNNMMLLICEQACAEGATLARRLGLDAKTFWDIASVSSGDSWALRTWYPMPDIIPTAAANNGFQATFRATLARKDIGLALAGGELVDVDLPAAKVAAAGLDRLIADGFGDYDCSLVIRNLDPATPAAPARP